MVTGPARCVPGDGAAGVIREALRHAVEQALGDEAEAVRLAGAWFEGLSPQQKLAAVRELSREARPGKTIQRAANEAVEKHGHDEAALRDMIMERLDARENPEFHAASSSDMVGGVMQALQRMITEEIAAWKKKHGRRTR